MWPVLAFLAATGYALAHVGSPDIFHEGSAGPYRWLVAIRPPPVIPGVAEIEVRSATSGVRQVRIVPLPVAGPGAKFAPTPDIAQPPKDDPLFFTGSLWMMTFGAWQVRVSVDGDRGRGELAVPVPAMATRPPSMQRAVGIGLFALMLLLSFGAVSIMGASVREAQLDPAKPPSRASVRRSRIVMALTAVVIGVLLFLSHQWWNIEAARYQRYLYKPLGMTATMESPSRLLLRMNNPGWFNRRMDDLLPDHNHLMHLFVLRMPQMDAVWHLHPEQIEPGTFTHQLPSIPAGRYKLFADIVHQNGLPETMTTELDLPAITGAPLAGDDAGGILPQSSRIRWEHDGAPLRPKQVNWFRFRVNDDQGQPTRALELYMGMQGHAAFVKRDGTVFAHVHPSGSVPMAALQLVAAGADLHALHGAHLPSVVSFPYGFPSAGDYRIFVQVKRAGRVETAAFDTRVQP
jgi:hypothetical protein